MTPIPLLALALALVGAVCLVLLIWNRRWPDLAIVLLAGGAMALYLEHGRRGPDRIGALVAEGVNADRSLSLHVRVEPGTPVWCSSVFSVESAPAGEPAKDSADWRVDLHPTERPDAKPLNADAAGKAVVTLPAPLVESAPNRAVHIWFNGTDNGTTRLEPPAESEPHAESAEPRPGEAGPLPEGAAERSEAGGVSHAESAEWRPTPEQTGRFRFDDKGKVVVAEVDAEGRVRLLENGPDSPPLRIRPATIRNRDLFVVEMDDIPDTGRHWTLALDFDAAKRAWIVVGEGETAADIVPEKPGYRTALFRRLDEPPSAPVP